MSGSFTGGVAERTRCSVCQSEDAWGWRGKMTEKWLWAIIGLGLCWTIGLIFNEKLAKWRCYP